jgi:DNA-binding NarL/FixJ family response regulator
VTPIRILVADDHEVVRHGIRRMIEGQPGWEICAEAADGRQAVEAAERTRPDVAILDIGMPELNGLDAARQILKASPRTEVLILTMHQSEQLVREVVSAGARGYVLKSDAGRTLVAAIEALRSRKPFLTSRVSEIVLEAYRDRSREAAAAPAPPRILTAREREVVQLLAEGCSNKDVARRLGISIKTAETHRSNIMRKLDLHSVTELVRYAIRNNIAQA